jgi:hypothetical protein
MSISIKTRTPPAYYGGRAAACVPDSGHNSGTAALLRAVPRRGRDVFRKGTVKDGSFGYDRTGTNSKKAAHKRAAFKAGYAIRCPAPPYAGADQGHCGGCTRNAGLAEAGRKNGRHTVEPRLSSSMTHGQGRTVRNKVEVLTADYPIKAPEIPNRLRIFRRPVFSGVADSVRRRVQRAIDEGYNFV